MPLTFPEIPEIGGVAVSGVRPTSATANVTMNVTSSEGPTTSLCHRGK